jgi:hypothetical protein
MIKFDGNIWKQKVAKSSDNIFIKRESNIFKRESIEKFQEFPKLFFKNGIWTF